VVPDLSPAHAAEKLFRRVRASAVLRVRLFVVEALYLETRVQGVPARRFGGIEQRALRNPLVDERDRLIFRPENRRKARTPELGSGAWLLLKGDTTRRPSQAIRSRWRLRHNTANQRALFGTRAGQDTM
jgi:hypothetical protein